MQIPEVIQDTTPEGLKRYSQDLARVVNKGLGLGFPGGTNGTIDNLLGAWVTVTVTNPALLGTNFTFTHNLDVQVSPTAGELNVIWGPVRWKWLGAAPIAAGSTVSLLYVDGTVARNSIELVVCSSLTPAVGDPLVVDVFFAPAVS